MLFIQIILIIFFLFAVSRVIERARARELTLRGAFGWVLFWVAAGVVVVLPNSTFYFAHLVGIGRGADLVVYLALAAIFFILFRLMVKLERLNRDITKLTRREALESHKNIKTSEH